MAEEIHECPECHVKRPYDEHDWRFDPRFDRAGMRSRIICGKCFGDVKWQVANGQSLTNHAAPYQRASESSKAGARAAQYKCEGQALQVLQHLVDAGEAGLTEPQVTFLTDFERSDSTRAINGLWQKSPYAEKADFKRVNPASGVMVQVYLATDAGRAFIAQSKQGKAA